MPTLTQFQPLFKKVVLVLGGFLVVAGLLYVVLSRTPVPSNRGVIPEELRNPPLATDFTQIRFGSPYKLAKGGSPGAILAKVKEVIPHPQNADEYKLFLDLNGQSPEIEAVAFVVRPIYTGPKETPGRETFIYRVETHPEEGHLQTPADVSALEEGITIALNYELNPGEEVFAVSIGIQGFIY